MNKYDFIITWHNKNRIRIAHRAKNYINVNEMLQVIGLKYEMYFFIFFNV